MTRVIIAGTRTFNNYRLLEKTIDEFVIGFNHGFEITVVSGGANGADKLGEQYARDRNYLINRFEASWNVYGKSAGPIRNEKMAISADVLIAFWDGKSRGTKNMIELAKKYNLLMQVIKY